MATTRKYNRGRIPTNTQYWVLGMVERVSKKIILIDLKGQQRTRGVLIPLITQYVRPGSVIMTDSWRAYDSLGSMNNYTQETNVDFLLNKNY